MRKINITIQIQDSDHIESNLHNTLQGILGHHMVDYQRMPDITELRENDETFRKINREYYKAKRLRNDYINSKR